MLLLALKKFKSSELLLYRFLLPDKKIIWNSLKKLCEFPHTKTLFGKP